jgi:hypothetical protein
MPDEKTTLPCDDLLSERDEIYAELEELVAEMEEIAEELRIALIQFWADCVFAGSDFDLGDCAEAAAELEQLNEDFFEDISPKVDEKIIEYHNAEAAFSECFLNHQWAYESDPDEMDEPEVPDESGLESEVDEALDEYEDIDFKNEVEDIILEPAE